MLSSSQDRWLRWLCRVYGLMLWAYPPDFRGDYRREMLVVFRTGARDVRQRGSPGVHAACRLGLAIHHVTREDDYDDEHARASMGCRASLGDTRGSRR